MSVYDSILIVAMFTYTASASATKTPSVVIYPKTGVDSDRYLLAYAKNASLLCSRGNAKFCYESAQIELKRRNKSGFIDFAKKSCKLGYAVACRELNRF